MDIVVTDTNIFIDMIDLDMLGLFFALPFTFHTTDFVVNEFTESYKEQKQAIQKYIDKSILIVKTFSGAEVEEIFQYKTDEPSKLSFTDCSVLLYAQKNGYIILSNDHLLRTKSIERSIRVHGTVFVFDLCVEMNMMTKEEAYQKLYQWMTDNPRAPRKECEKRLHSWYHQSN